MFEHLKQAQDYTKSNLMYGVTDFGNLHQFNMYEGGYATLVVINIPQFMEDLIKVKPIYEDLINNYKNILEREFKSLDGLDDITTEQLDITDGITTMNVIGKVTMQGGTEFTLRYQEKSGSPITRFHELYLRGLRDPRGNQVKHYNGVIGSKEFPNYKPDFDKETFKFLYINTDNTMRNVEKAYLLVGAQLTNAKTNIYNYEKGGVEFKDVDVTFTALPITSTKIDEKAQDWLDWIHSSSNEGKSRIIVDSSDFDYTGVDETDPASVEGYVKKKNTSGNV